LCIFEDPLSDRIGADQRFATVCLPLVTTLIGIPFIVKLKKKLYFPGTQVLLGRVRNFGCVRAEVSGSLPLGKHCKNPVKFMPKID
jgi:hypothetical protein